MFIRHTNVEPNLGIEPSTPNVESRPTTAQLSFISVATGYYQLNCGNATRKYNLRATFSIQWGQRLNQGWTLCNIKYS